MKKRKKVYNWHFWLPYHKVQLIIDDKSYGAALRRATDIMQQIYRFEKVQLGKQFKFQFGQLAN